MALSYEKITDDCFQVFVDDYFAGCLIKAKTPSQPDPEGRLFIGPWVYDGTDTTAVIGWPDIRELAMEIERRNTHWNWSLKNEQTAGRQDSPENPVPVQGAV